MAIWWTILAHTWHRVGKDNLSALAAAIAFYALLSIFPTLTAVVSLYGLVADPSLVERELAALEGILPPEAVKLVAVWLQDLIQGPPARFGVGLLVSVLLALWGAWSATGILMTAVNLCYGEEEKRSFVRFNLRALALSAGLALLGGLTLALVAVLPAALDLLPVPEAWHDVITLVRWPVLAGIVMLTLAILYRCPDGNGSVGVRGSRQHYGSWARSPSRPMSRRLGVMTKSMARSARSSSCSSGSI
jgi:membrane protein